MRILEVAWILCTRAEDEMNEAVATMRRTRHRQKWLAVPECSRLVSFRDLRYAKNAKDWNVHPVRLPGVFLRKCDVLVPCSLQRCRSLL